MKIFEKIEFVIYGILILLGVIIMISNGGNSKSSKYNSRAYNHQNHHQQIERDINARNRAALKEAAPVKQAIIIQNKIPVTTSNTNRQRKNYKELWDECENLSSLLYYANIDHEEPSYPMSYHDLENLRDELEALVSENDAW